MEQPKPLYRLQSVQPASSYSPVDGAIKAYRVNYVTASGVTDYVTIPESEYSADKVQELVQAASLLHEHILSIEGPATMPGQVAPPHPWNKTG